MAEKRNLNRHKKRLPVRFGSGEATKLAFTEDISDDGIFIRTALTWPPGTVLQVEITLPDDEYVFFEGMVCWAKKYPPQLINKVQKAGFGLRIVRFIAGKAAYANLVGEMHARYN